MTDELEESEFGTGFVYPMILFAKHAGELKLRYASFATNAGAPRTLDPLDYEMWFYAAGDHVMGMKVPESLKETRVGKLGQEFLDFVQPLRLHYDAEKPTVEDFRKTFQMLEELAMEIDRHLGAKPVKATWN